MLEKIPIERAPTSSLIQRRAQITEQTYQLPLPRLRAPPTSTYAILRPKVCQLMLHVH